MVRGRTLLLVAAHPDDAYGMAGTVALGAVRREEDERAWRALGRSPDRHEWLGYEDGGLVDVPFEELVDRIATILEEERPDVVGSFGPDGITGHPDHVRLGAATDAAFDRVAARPLEGLHRLVHGALPQSVFERWNDTRRRKALTPRDPGAVYHLRGVPDDTIGITVDTSSVALRIVAGLREHRSQRHVIAEPGVTDEQLAPQHLARALRAGTTPAAVRQPRAVRRVRGADASLRGRAGCDVLSSGRTRPPTSASERSTRRRVRSRTRWTARSPW